MMNRKCFLYLFVFLALQSQAQSIEGLWLAQEVKVGDELLTPTAKWFRFSNDSTYTSGNGWLQNEKGSWTLNLNQQSLGFLNEDNLPDEYGTFTIKFQDSTMIWNRTEDGQQVQVKLKRISEIPRAPWDQLIGNWALQTDSLGSQSDSTTILSQIYFRWDRGYRASNLKSVRKRSYWYMHPHRNDLLIWSSDMDTHEVYGFTLSKDTLKLRPKDGSKPTLIYKRTP